MSNPSEVARAKINAMEAEKAKLEAEIVKLQDFIALFEELSSGNANVAVDHNAMPQGAENQFWGVNRTSQHESEIKAEAVEKVRRRVKSSMRPSQTVELMERIIREVGRPMTRGDIVEAFERRDVLIPFEDKARYIGTIAWRHKGMFINIEGRGYWLRDEPVPPEKLPSADELGL